MGILDRIKAGFSPNKGTEIQASIGSAYDGADRMNLEMARWNPPLLSADGEILGSKETLDARSRDVVRNDPLISNAVDLYRNGTVGTKMILNSKPNGRYLGWDDDTVDAVQEEIEALFEIYAHSDRCYVDAAQKMNLTDIVRMGVGGSVFSGEFLGAFEWLPDQPFRTALQVIDPDRLSNPNMAMDTEYLRGGIERNASGSAIAYHIRTGHPNDIYGMNGNSMKWKRIPARKPWGRSMFLHIYEQNRPGQSRGIAKMVSALRQIHMTSKFSDVALQRETINATIAAVLESDLKPNEVFPYLGGEDTGNGNPDFLAQINDAHLKEALSFAKAGQAAKLNGAMIPYLPVGTKLNVKSLGEGSLGTEFEKSLIRKISSGLGVSSEELSKNFSDTSFAGAKAAMAETFKQMQAVKRTFPDKIASGIYRNWLEEVVERGLITSLPSSARRSGWINEGFNLDALSKCTWIGAARGTIDEYNEVRAAKIRYEMGITTMEHESARLGLDWRDVQKQRRREAKYLAPTTPVETVVETQTPNVSAELVERIEAVEQFVDDAQQNA